VSVALMAVLFVPGVDPSRLYYGTDTRAGGLLIGAALAVVWTPELRRTSSRGSSCPTVRGFGLDRARGRFRRRWGWTAPVLLDALGLAALGTLAFLCLRLGEFDPPLYRGGLAAVSLATAALIVALTHPRTRIGSALLGCRLLRWIGLRSYGIYLWHWPVFMVTRPGLDVPLDGWPLLALRLVVTVVLAELSYRYVETPVRHGAIGHAWRSLREARGFKRWDLGVRYAGIVGPVVAVCVVLGVAVGHAKPPETPDYLSSTKAIHTGSSPGTSGASAAAEKAPPDVEAPSASSENDNPTIARRTAKVEEGSVPNTQNREAEAPKESVAGAKRVPPAGAGAEAPVGAVSAVGDSVMLGAAGKLERAMPTLTTIDAEVGFQAAAAIDVLAARRDAGELGEVVIVHIGSNGVYTAEQFDETMRVLAGVRRVVFVNVNVPRAWEQPNNEVISEGVRRYPNAVLADWYSASVNHPEYFVEDGVHLQIKGQRVYADLIAGQIEAL
jgi:hypothetical protein